MARLFRTLLPSPSRLTPSPLIGLRYSSTSSAPLFHLIAELRKRTTVSIQKAREALLASNGDILGALEWLEKDHITTGQRKIEKVAGRFAGQGLIGVSVLSRGTGETDDLGVRAAMIELNCETDFVGRNDIFRNLTEDLAFTTAFIMEPRAVTPKSDHKGYLDVVDLNDLRDAPLMVRCRDAHSTSKTVSEAIRDAITALGENIKIRRAVTFIHDPVHRVSGVGLRVSSYVHGTFGTLPNKRHSTAFTEAQGRIGALVAIGLKTSRPSRLHELLQRVDFNIELNMLERALARQIVGLKPTIVHGRAEDALYNQAFDMLATSGGQSVGDVLFRWAEEKGMIEGNLQDENPAGLGVTDFARWEVGEGL